MSYDNITPITYEAYSRLCDTQREDRERTYREHRANARVIKHRWINAPFGCEHCGYVWYGWMAHHRSAPTQTLCHECWNELDKYTFRKYDDFYCSLPDEHTETTWEAIFADTRAWIADKSNKPLPLADARRFHRSIPKWLRSAILAGLVKPNSGKRYVVYSRDNVAVSVDVIEKGGK